MFTLKNLLKLIGKNALISLVVILITLFVISFIAKKIESISNKVALNHKLEDASKIRTELIKILKEDAVIILGNDVKIENAFPSSNNILDFVDEIDTLAKNNNISQTYRFGTPAPLSTTPLFKLETISYTNNFSGNIFSFTNYLKEYEKLPYFTKIDSFSISSQEKNDWTGVSNIRLSGTLYTKKI